MAGLFDGLFGDKVAPFGLNQLVTREAGAEPAPAPAPAPAPSRVVPVPPPASPGTGLFDDLVPPQAGAPPVASPAQTTGMFDDLVPANAGSLTNTPVGIGERFLHNVGEGFRSTFLGAATDAAAVGLAPGFNPIDPNTGQPLAGPTPRQQVQQSILDRREQDAQFPSWTDTPVPQQAPQSPLEYALSGNTDGGGSVYIPPGVDEKLATGGTALAGALVGGMASPESFVAGPEAAQAIKYGAPVVREIAGAAGVQAGVQAGANVGAQSLNIATGTQEHFDPGQTVESAGMGALFGGLHPVAAAIHRGAAGPTPGGPPERSSLFTNTPSQGDGIVDRAVRAAQGPEQFPGTPAPRPEPAPAPAPASGQTGLFDDLVPAKPADQTPAPPPAPAPTPAAETHDARGTRLQDEWLSRAKDGTLDERGILALNAATSPGFDADKLARAARWAAKNGRQDVIDHIREKAQRTLAAAKTDVETGVNPRVKELGAETQAAAETVLRAVDINEKNITPGPPPTPPETAPKEIGPGTPAADPNAGTVTTPAGRKLDVRYEAVPADTLTAATGDLQPRDRAGRLASDAQINDIAANLDPSRLMRSTESDRGAPIVGPDHVVESGNGRVAAIRRAADQNPEAYARYVQAIKDAGHDVTGMDKPVLIARRVTELTPEERRASVIEHNTSATQVMSASEQAQIDGRNLTSEMLGRYDHTQPATGEANRAFVRDWINTLPEAERNRVQAGDGVLSTDGQRRLEGAMLARAYDDKGTLARGLESTDDHAKSISGGMADAAPAWAKLRAGVADGKVGAAWDLSKNLTEAADLVRTAREKKQTLSDIVNQQDVFRQVDPATEQFVRALYSPDGKRAASRPAIAETLRRYADEGQRQTTGGDMFGAAHEVKPIDALRAIVGRRDEMGARPADTQGSLLAPKIEPAPVAEPVASPEPPAAPKPPVAIGPKAAPDPRAVQIAKLQKTIKRDRANVDEMRRTAATLADPKLRTEVDAAVAKHEKTLAKQEAQLAKLRKEAEPVVSPEPAQTKLAADDRPLADMSAHVNPDGTTRPPLGGVRPGRDFNEGTSLYRQVFRDAGRDPDAMVSRPIAEQNRVIASHVRDTFGFKDVVIDPKQAPKEVRDQLSNFYQNARAMANVVQMPYRALGLDGRVTFTTKPYRTANQALGTYFPGKREISIPGRSNSFAHEWTHALDHYLSDVLAKNPAAMKLLSQTKGVGDGKVGNRRTAPGSQAEAFVNVMKTLYGKDAASAAEALRLQYHLRSTDPNVRAQAQLKLTHLENEYAKNAKTADAGAKTPYWSSPAEMLARAHEAYVGNLMELQGMDRAAVAKPYYDGAGPKDNFAKYYPQAGERDVIFHAFQDLHDKIREANTLGADPAGPRPDGLDVVSPRDWKEFVDTSADPGFYAAMKREVQAMTNFRQQFKDNLGISDKAADPGNTLRLGTRIADGGRALTYSARAIGKVLIARQESATARAAFQTIMDKLTPAEGLRTAKEANAREIGKVFEEDVRHHARPNINQFEKILGLNGLGKMTDEQGMMLRHMLTEGRADSYVPDGATAPKQIPANIVKANGQLRYLLDQEWERLRKAGVDVGYAKSGFYPRMYDDLKIMGNGDAFKADAAKLHALMFEQEVGTDPAKLLEAHERVPEARRNLSPNENQKIEQLKQTLAEIDKELNKASPDAAKLATLRDDAQSLHDELHDPVRDDFARAAAETWHDQISVGDPTDFETRGPSASFTKGRVLPPEADTIMRNWVVTKPEDVIPRYFQASARKAAWAERFGASGRGLDDLLYKAHKGGARPEDIRRIRYLVETVTGRNKSGLPADAEKVINGIHAAGVMALMARSAWSSLGEPSAMLAVTGSPKATFKVYAYQLGGLFRTADSKARAALADAVGITTSRFHDSIIADRTDGHYNDNIALGKLTTRFYRTIGLTQLTNLQRQSTMGAGHGYLVNLAKELQGDHARHAREAAVTFRDFGVPDAEQKMFAEWLTSNPALPSMADLDTKGGHLWSTAITRLTDQVIQDPLRASKPVMASASPIGRGLFALMGFNYSFFHNVIERPIDRRIAGVKEDYRDARDAGRSKLGAAASVSGQAAKDTIAIGAAGAAIYGSAYISTVAREALLNADTYQKHEEDGTLDEWLTDLAFQRSGFNGTLDPLAQAMSGLKYQRDLSAIATGAPNGFFLQAATNILKGATAWAHPDTGTDTNSADFNFVKGMYAMFGVPAITAILTAAPGGPVARVAAGAGLQYLTRPATGDALAESLVGEKGTKEGGIPPTPKKPKDESANDSGSGVPLGLVDDVAAPAARVAVPLWSRLPRVGKIAAGVAGAAAAGSALSDEFGRFSP